MAIYSKQPGGFMKWVVILVVGLMMGAGPTKQSADGVAFPQVPDNILKANDSNPIGGMPQTLLKTEDLMLRPLGAIPAKVYSSDKSAKLLASKLTRVLTVENVSPSINNNEVTRLRKTMIGKLVPACEWFTLGFAGSNVAGIDAPLGYVEKIVLYFPDARNAQRDLLASYGGSVKQGIKLAGWIPTTTNGESLLSVADDGSGVRWKPLPGNYAVYLILSPIGDDVRMAIAKHDLAIGMKLWEAYASVGDYKKTYSEAGGVEIYEFSSYSKEARFENGQITRVIH